MAKRKVERFTVTGLGQFPFDMLRYDGCYPSSEQEARKLQEYCNNLYTTERSLGQRLTVELRTCHQSAPTLGRWSSFLWRVTHINGELI